MMNKTKYAIGETYIKTDNKNIYNFIFVKYIMSCFNTKNPNNEYPYYNDHHTIMNFLKP